MLYLECKRRLDRLREFQKLVAVYFANQVRLGFGASPHENPQAQSARQLINIRMGEAVESCSLMGHSGRVYYTPPPMTGGPSMPLSLIENIFDLWRFQIPNQQLEDCLSRAIGDYERTARRLLWQMFNPFFWAGWIFTQALRIPFRILGAAGFNAGGIEASAFGKLAKAVFGFVIFISALLESLNLLGWLTTLKHLVESAVVHH